MDQQPQTGGLLSSFPLKGKEVQREELPEGMEKVSSRMS